MSLALDPLASDERWRALGGILVLIQGCGSPDVAHRARRTFLRRLLASLVRKAKRLAADAVASVPLLLQARHRHVPWRVAILCESPHAEPSHSSVLGSRSCVLSCASTHSSRRRRCRQSA